MKANELTELYLSRIDQLLERLPVKATGGAQFVRDEESDRAIVEGCFGGALTIVESLYGANSVQAKSLTEVRKSFSKTRYAGSYEISSLAAALRGLLLNYKEEIKLGLIRSIAEEAAGEVFGDLTAMAKRQLGDGRKDVAAVLASAALEDALKRKALQLGIHAEGKTLDAVIGALKTKGFFSGAQGPIVSSFVKLRNSAMHADWSKISEPDVSSLLGFLEPFLLEYFT